MLKKLSSIGLVLLLICTLHPSAAAAQDYATPEADVKAFYPWYIKQVDQLKDVLFDDHIYIYVEKTTVDALRDDAKHDKLPGDSDYFMKVQDVDPPDWNSHTVIRPAVMLDDVAVILATFGIAGTKSNLVIFLRKHGDTWKIMKVEDTQDHFWPPSRK
ncbi:DUF3828 domain-containing protein [Dyella caseinilytica]|uniref:DUF3828 domain-containing protein n=1 Tax=Dyella caseinilytica TaxID=1849581 RepID=A0ABX7GTS1_9GAMM|nr:DUF3828 domain-containing protein [Dyella caseinilytica]QRN53416.1 DUF3828 domain-containing protein [Dyella caseinilytica]GFZ86338.1 hypothetical protein GCM10011408_00890 [Dyella caseinilytica]